MKRLLSLASLFAVSLAFSGCGGGQSDFRPSLVGNWRVRSFSVENAAAVNCPSPLSAGNFFSSCTANSLFTFREDGTVLDPNLNTRTYSRKGLVVIYGTPATTTTTIEFFGETDNVLHWRQAKTDTLPAVEIILERL